MQHDGGLGPDGVQDDAYMQTYNDVLLDEAMQPRTVTKRGANKLVRRVTANVDTPAESQSPMTPPSMLEQQPVAVAHVPMASSSAIPAAGNPVDWLNAGTECIVPAGLVEDVDDGRQEIENLFNFNAEERSRIAADALPAVVLNAPPSLPSSRYKAPPAELENYREAKAARLRQCSQQSRW